MKPTISLFWSQIDCEKPNVCYVQARYGGGPIVAQLHLSVDEQAGWIGSLFVQEHARKKGLASLLIERACAISRAYKFESVGLSVHKDNKAAKSLYRKLGFVGFMDGHEGYQQLIKIL